MSTIITRQTLAFSIYSLVFQQRLLSDRLHALPAEAEDVEHLSETILDMERALGELRDLYDEYAVQPGAANGFDALHANAERDYEAFAAQGGVGRQG